MLKRIIPCFLLLAIVFSFAVPVQALAVGDFIDSVVNYSDAITGLLDDYAPSWEVDKDMDNQLDKAYGGCTVAADGNHVINDFGPSIGAPGLVSRGTCSLCHEGLRQILAYDKAHGGETGTYQDYVAQNYPLDGYGSDGGLYWYPTWADVASAGVYCGYGGRNPTVHVEFGTITYILNFSSYLSGSCSLSGNSLVGSLSDINYNYDMGALGCWGIWCVVPVSGVYSCIGNVALISGASSLSFPVESRSVSYGGQVSLSCSPDNFPVSGDSLSFQFFLPVFKVVPSQSVDNNYYVQSSRVGSITFNIVDQQMQNYYPNVQFFNEETNIYYDVTTGQQQSVSSWTYDYSSRTYHLTLEDGSSLDIEFSDDSINVKVNGEITQKYYYTVEKETQPTPTPAPTPVDPTVTPTPDPGTGTEPTPIPPPTPEPGTDPTPTPGGGDVETPTPTPDPGSPTPTPEPGTPTPTPDPGTPTPTSDPGGGDVDTPTPTPEPVPTPTPSPTPIPGGGDVDPPTPSPEPGGDVPPDGFFDWLKQWLIEFKEWLGNWLDKLFNKEPGDVTIDESDNSVHINDQDDLDYDIYYTDDSGEERKTSLRDLLHKFDFLRDIYDIGRDLFSIVGADAAAAHAYNSTGTVDITPYLGDLRTVAAADVMPIAGGSGAPSLKINLGAAQSHYGYNYGGEMEILDLSWYTPYKGTVDNLLSGFLWLFFAWRLFKHAPSIISGAGMVSEKAEDIHDGKRH